MAKELKRKRSRPQAGRVPISGAGVVIIREPVLVLTPEEAAGLSLILAAERDSRRPHKVIFDSPVVWLPPMPGSPMPPTEGFVP